MTSKFNNFAMGCSLPFFNTMNWNAKLIDVLLNVGLNVRAGDVLIVKMPESLLSLVGIFAERCEDLGVSPLIFSGISPDYLADFPAALPLSQVSQGFLSEVIRENRLGMIFMELPHHRAASGKAVLSTTEAMLEEAFEAGKISYVKTIYPNSAWAARVYPEKGRHDALNALENAFVRFCRLDHERPVDAWRVHQKQLRRRRKLLEAMRLRTIHFKNSGCDCVFQLHNSCRWMGGESANPFSGRNYLPNVPSEEIFTVPQRLGVNGKLCTSKPLVYQNQLVKGIELEFVAGKVVRARADEGAAILRKILAHDEGSSFLGEVALVSAASPMGMENRIFYNTLLDENAGCHIALGKGSPAAVPGAYSLDRAALLKRGINNSALHVDLVVGSADLEVTGRDDLGKETIILSHGEWVLKGEN